MRTRPLPAMKLAVIGGGSTYTPELVAGLARERERLDLRELVLHDIDPERRGIVMRSLLDAGHRAVGLCNVAIGLQRYVARMLDVEPERVLVDQVGLNHLTWVRAVHVDGDDVLPDLLAERAEELAESVDLPPSLLERLGVIPSYYLRYFYFHDRVLEEQLSAKPRAAEVAEIEHELLELYRDPALTTKPAVLERRGGAHYSEAATQLIAALATGSGDVQVVDLRNDGTLAGLADVRDDGGVLAPVRGPQSSPHHLGLDGSLGVIGDLLAQAIEEAGLPNGDGPVAEVGQLLLAGVDFPSEAEEMTAAASSRRLASRISVGNDTFAVLRAGTEHGWGVGVVCGSGINCVGVAPDGRKARFPALGAISGDWGGGFDVGLDALSAAARSEDGRGPRTSLERLVPECFGLERPSELAESIHRSRIP